MKLTVPFIEKAQRENSFPMDAALIRIDQNNWPDQFPYSPEVKVYAWHNGKSLFLDFEVDEDYVAAVAKEDNGNVYCDSCVEFFIAFDKEGYYNIETNCAGKVLMSHRKGRKEAVEYATPEILAGIKRIPSLGSDPFECKENKFPWKMTIEIPASSFFKHQIKDFHGVEAKGNFYKCGDNLPKVHFLSWNKIETENPDFHRPEFFGSLHFE